MKEETETDVIKLLSGTTENQCSCKDCVNMCYRCPCLGTPTDILKIMEAGHTDKIILTDWAAAVAAGFPVITMFQIKHETGTACVFLKNDLCSLHDKGLKPTEGKLASHTGIDKIIKNKIPAGLAIASTWLLPGNTKTIKTIIQKLGIKATVETKNI